MNPSTDFSRAASRLLAAVWALAVLLVVLALVVTWSQPEPTPADLPAVARPAVLLAEPMVAIAIAKVKLD